MPRSFSSLRWSCRSSVLLAVALAGCEKKEPPQDRAAQAAPSNSAAQPKEAAAKFDRVPRADFNRVAAELALPLFWTADANKDGVVDPTEVAVYWGLEPGAAITQYVDKGAFTARFATSYDRIAKRAKEPEALGGTAEDGARRKAVQKELSQGRVTLVATDLSKASPEEKRFVGIIDEVAQQVERLYAKQQGTSDLARKIADDDAASKTLFFRGQGPKCEAPATQNDPNCSAIAGGAKGKLSGLYPAELLTNDKFCDELTKSEQGKKEKTLLDPFTVVTKDAGGALKAVPYHEAFKADVVAISEKLKSAAGALGDKEPALKAYLEAAAQAFLDDKWWPADEAWAKMDAKNSKYYLRVAPDEVYDEPCSTKALFHVSFGLINQGSLKWQTKLDPLKSEMEKALAELAGAPYKAREVSFKLPDFVDIALNAGDSRKPFGATIGQSLPNFGPVANGGRGRTVAMTNFYSDPDSVASLKDQAASLLCKETMAKYTSDPEPQLMSTVLHEAAHNLGPAHQYRVAGKIDREVFGGPLASTLEELKAQTAALYFTDWLADKKLIAGDDAEKAHVRDVVWAFGHVSRGMYTEDHHPRNYSQLAAIQLGWLMKSGAATFKTDEVAANGTDKGCFTLDLQKFPAATKALMVQVAHVKGAGDKAAADAMVKEFVDVAGDKKKVHEVVTERMTRAPKSSFVYAVRLD